METLRLFCDVARFRSFSQAAAEHDITQSAASQRVNALEKRLGVTLLDRSVRPLELTGAGQLYHHECLAILERYDRLEKRISRLRQEPEGLVHVNAIYSAGIDLLSRIKDQFEARHPRVTVLIQYTRPEEVYEAVSQQRCELGLVSYPQRFRDVGMIPLRNEVMSAVVPAAHPLAGRSGVHASELGRWPMISFEAELPAGRRIRRYLREHGSAPEVRSAFDNIDTIKSALTVSIDSFSILPKRTVLRDRALGTLAVLELEPALVRPMGIIFPRRGGAAREHASPRAFTPAVQAFVDFLLEHAGPKVDADTLAGVASAPPVARPLPERRSEDPSEAVADARILSEA